MARTLNVAEVAILNMSDPKDYQKVKQQLNGRFLTMGRPVPKEEQNAPYWWQGDEEAYESMMSAMSSSRRPRRRR